MANLLGLKNLGRAGLLQVVFPQDLVDAGIPLRIPPIFFFLEIVEISGGRGCVEVRLFCKNPNFLSRCGNAS
jgi:hypothetical protein